MVSSCNQIKRDSWSMNLCVETAPNALTTLWEGGAARHWGLGIGTGGWWEVPSRLAWPGPRAVKGLLRRDQAADGLSLSWHLFNSSVPLGAHWHLSVPVTYRHFLHGCFRSVIFQHELASSKHAHLGTSPGRLVKTHSWAPLLAFLIQ